MALFKLISAAFFLLPLFGLGASSPCGSLELKKMAVSKYGGPFFLYTGKLKDVVRDKDFDGRALNRNILTQKSTDTPIDFHNLRIYRSGFQIEKAISKLTSESVVLDSGSGLGVAAIGLNQLTGSSVTLVSAHDEYLPLAKFFKAPAQIKHSTFVLDRQEMGFTWPSFILGMEKNAFLTLGEELGLKELDLGAVFDANEAKLLAVQFNQSTIQRLKKLYRTQKISFSIGLAEEKLKETKNEVQLLLDYFGSYTNSPARHLLIRSYYDSLIPGGEAHILEKDFNFTKIFVKGSEIPYLQYLARAHPEIFSLYPAIFETYIPSVTVSAFVLKIRKPIKNALTFDALFPQKIEPRQFVGARVSGVPGVWTPVVVYE